MQIKSLKPTTFSGKVAAFLFIFAGYFVLGYLGLKLASINNNASPIWPASGFAIGSLLLFGLGMAPAVFLGGVVTTWTTGIPVEGYLGVGLGNLAEALVGAFIIRSFITRRFFNTYSEFISICASSIVAAGVSATIGITSLLLSGALTTKDGPYAWYTWWSGDIIGILILLPLYLALLRTDSWNLKFNWKTIFYGIFILGAMMPPLYMVFVKGFNQALVWSLTPIIVVIGVKSGIIYSRILQIILCSYLIYLSILGYGPFEQGNMNRNLLYVQSLIACYSIAVLFVSPLKTGIRLDYKYIAGIVFGWISVFIAIHFITAYERQQTFLDFKRTTRSSLLTLLTAAKQYDLLLGGTSAMFSVKPHFSQDDWKTYIKSAKPTSFSNIINSLGVVQIFKNNELKAFETERGRKIKFIDPEYTSRQKNHYIVTHYERFFQERSFLGIDLGSEKKRREAAIEAREKNKTIITEPLKFINYKNNPEALILFNPIFLKDNQFYGWTYASVFVSDFFKKPLSQFSYLIKTRISQNGKEVFLYNKFNNQEVYENFKSSPFYLTEKLELLGKEYLLEFYPSDLFFRRHIGYSTPLALLLNLFVLFISGFLLQQLTFGQRAEELVEKRTKELELSKMQLIQSSKMASLGEMASGMAHEINNPLTIIQGKVKVISLLLEDEQINNPLLTNEIDKIKDTTDRIGKIIKGLRNFSRVTVNDPFEYFPLNRLIHETLDLCSERFKAEGIDLRIENIPDYFIKCRPAEISQVLINLFNNSSDAVQQFDHKWIELKFKRISSDRLSLIITDSGNGISPEIADKIMEPFFTTKDVRKGTGLGLSISKGIVESHGGVLSLDQNHSHTRFIIDLEYSETEKIV